MKHHVLPRYHPNGSLTQVPPAVCTGPIGRPVGSIGLTVCLLLKGMERGARSEGRRIAIADLAHSPGGAHGAWVAEVVRLRAEVSSDHATARILTNSATRARGGLLTTTSASSGQETRAVVPRWWQRSPDRICSRGLGLLAGPQQAVVRRPRRTAGETDVEKGRADRATAPRHQAARTPHIAIDRESVTLVISCALVPSFKRTILKAPPRRSLRGRSRAYSERLSVVVSRLSGHCLLTTDD